MEKNHFKNTRLTTPRFKMPEDDNWLITEELQISLENYQNNKTYIRKRKTITNRKKKF